MIESNIRETWMRVKDVVGVEGWGRGNARRAEGRWRGDVGQVEGWERGDVLCWRPKDNARWMER